MTASTTDAQGRESRCESAICVHTRKRPGDSERAGEAMTRDRDRTRRLKFKSNQRTSKPEPLQPRLLSLRYSFDRFSSLKLFRLFLFETSSSEHVVGALLSVWPQMRHALLQTLLVLLAAGTAVAHLRQPLPPSVPPVTAASRPIVPPSQLPPQPTISPAPGRPAVTSPAATNTTRSAAKLQAGFDATVDLKEEVYTKLRGMVKEVCNRAHCTAHWYIRTFVGCCADRGRQFGTSRGSTDQCVARS
jgi:hypothetical protein